MESTSPFKLVMISAGFEHGGNITLRFLDGHPELYVYPFESQLGNKHTVDFLSSLERFQYRYPEFPTGLSIRELYELFFDEELKTFLRKPNGTKFKNANIVMDEQTRIQCFCLFLQDKSLSRAHLVEAFFRSTFEAWSNYKSSGKNRIYVGYSPIIGIDAHKIIHDFPDGHIVHIVRNPFSAYSDTKLRPFPLPLRQYVISWNLYHHILMMQQRLYPDHITLVRYEDIVSDTERTMKFICSKIGIHFSETMLYPSFNGVNITDNIYPWGTINKATQAENEAAADRLSIDEISMIIKLSSLMVDQFQYRPFAQQLLDKKGLYECV